ncbi:MAG: acyltransferase [Burkholderiales bacterium]|nr:acyltransferase [Burkholderiales bacterium]
MDVAPRPRVASVDAVRVGAILAVIAIHTTPFEHAASPIGRSFDFATLLNQATRFAVPFFLVVAGYFWARKVAEAGELRAPTTRLVRRALLVWLAWSAIYLLPVNLFGALEQGALGPLKVIYWNAALVVKRPAIALLEGTSPHLWFLVALAFCAATSAVFMHFGLRRVLVVLAAVLYALGLAGQAYPDAPFGFHVDPAFRNGHLFALAFFVTGAWLQRRGATAGWFPVGAVLALAGLLLHLLEVSLAHTMWGTPLERDYVAGTYLFGVGAAMVALSGTRRLGWQRVATLGPWVLGIYASHMVFVELLKPLDRRLTGSPLWEIAYPAAVFALALGATRLLARFTRTRPIVI